MQIVFDPEDLAGSGMIPLSALIFKPFIISVINEIHLLKWKGELKFLECDKGAFILNAPLCYVLPSL